MATGSIIDLDEVLMGWAAERLGKDYAVDKVDTSKLDIRQRGVVYQSSGNQNWWQNSTIHEEYFDNDEGSVSSWQFSHKVGYKSTASWVLIKAFKSTKFVPISVSVQYPAGSSGSTPLEVNFETSNLNIKKTSDCSSEWTASDEVSVEPYASTHVSAQVKCCRLQDVTFTTDIVMSGSIKIVGHKKNRKWSKHEMTVGIADALSGKEGLGFMVYDNSADPNGPARIVIFKMEGVCTGDVGVEAIVKQDHISSLV